MDGLLTGAINSDDIDVSPPNMDINQPQTYYGRNPGLTPDEWVRLALDQLLVANVDVFRTQIRELLEQTVVTTAKRAKDNTSRQMIMYYTIPFHYDIIINEILHANF